MSYSPNGLDGMIANINLYVPRSYRQVCAFIAIFNFRRHHLARTYEEFWAKMQFLKEIDSESTFQLDETRTQKLRDILIELSYVRSSLMNSL